MTDEENLSHFRFAGDIILLTDDQLEFRGKLEKLQQAKHEDGLKQILIKQKYSSF